jgi:hypothetical protein
MSRGRRESFIGASINRSPRGEATGKTDRLEIKTFLADEASNLCHPERNGGSEATGMLWRDLGGSFTCRT